MAINTSTTGRWFRRLMWLGIIANLALALPSMAAPDQMVEFSRLPTVTPQVWVRFAGLLLLLLSAFYAPAAIDPDRYRANAWIAVASRLAGVVFFSLEPAAYRMLGLFDLVFFMPQLLLLFLATRSERAAGTTGASTS